MKNKTLVYPLIALAVLIFVALACDSSSTGVKVSETTIPTPTATPSKLTYQDIKTTYDSKTEIQQKDYLNSLKGIRVHWKATITEIDKDGEITLGLGEGLFEAIYLDGVPLEQAKLFNKGQVIEFDATIYDAFTIIGIFYLKLNEPVLY